MRELEKYLLTVVFCGNWGPIIMVDHEQKNSRLERIVISIKVYLEPRSFKHTALINYIVTVAMGR